MSNQNGFFTNTQNWQCWHERFQWALNLEPLQWQIQDFTEGGTPTPKSAYYFSFFFAENCMKMKELGPPGSRPARPPLGSVNALLSQFDIYLTELTCHGLIRGSLKCLLFMHYLILGLWWFSYNLQSMTIWILNSQTCLQTNAKSYNLYNFV